MIISDKYFKLHPIGLPQYFHAPRHKAGYWLACSVFGLILLANLDAVGGMLEEAIPILLEWAEKGSESLFEIFGLSPRWAQGITAYIGFTAALIIGYRLVSKIHGLTQQTRQTLDYLKAESRNWISTAKAAAYTGWTNLPWDKKLLLAVAGTFLFVASAMVLSTTFGLAVAAVF